MLQRSIILLQGCIKLLQGCTGLYYTDIGLYYTATGLYYIATKTLQKARPPKYSRTHVYLRPLYRAPSMLRGSFRSHLGSSKHSAFQSATLRVPGDSYGVCATRELYIDIYIYVPY